MRTRFHLASLLEEASVYYLERIGSSCEYPEPLRRMAIDIERVLSFSEAHGEMMQWRMRSACEAAFEAYSPKAEAAQKGPRL